MLEQWYDTGKFKPYSNDELFDVLLDMKKKVHNRIRLIRIVRDINDHYIMGGCKLSHMRQLLHLKMEETGHICKCIRCRSAKGNTIDPKSRMKVDQFESSGSTEYFVSYVSKDDLTLYGFVDYDFPTKRTKSMKYQGVL